MFSGFPGFFGSSNHSQEEEPEKQIDNKSLYEILQLNNNATTDQIRKSFRKKALKIHPDKGGDPQQFKKLKQAYEVLSNPQKRDLYDKFGMEGVEAGGNPKASGFDLFDLFTGGSKKQKGIKKGKPKLIQLDITLQQAYNGCLRKINHKRLKTCDPCNGKGGQNVQVCSKCKGRRMVQKLVQLGPGMYSQSTQPCNECKAQGYIMQEKDRCKVCKGKKVVEQQKVLEVTIEPGTPHEHDYILPCESDQIPGTIAGDVYVRNMILKHDKFVRKGADLIYKKKINLLEALTGVCFKLHHLDGKEYVIATSKGDIISPNSIKTIYRKGMPFYKDAMSHGNLYIEFSVQFPKNGSITKQKGKLLKQLLPCKLQHKESLKKTGKAQELYLQDFDQSSLNPNAQGGRVREDNDDDERGRGTHMQCQQQ